MKVSDIKGFNHASCNCEMEKEYGDEYGTSSFDFCDSKSWSELLLTIEYFLDYVIVKVKYQAINAL